jgi:hypothetical protein
LERAARTCDRPGALITLIQQGRVQELLAQTSADPDLAPEDLDALEALAEQTLDLFPTPTPADPASSLGRVRRSRRSCARCCGCGCAIRS